MDVGMIILPDTDTDMKFKYGKVITELPNIPANIDLAETSEGCYSSKLKQFRINYSGHTHL